MNKLLASLKLHFNTRGYHGNMMVLLSVMVPIIFSFFMDFGFDKSSIYAYENYITYKSRIDYSFLNSYISFGIFHVCICIAVYWYCSSTIRDTSTLLMYKNYKKQRYLITIIVVLAFLLIINCWDTSLKKLSYDLLLLTFAKLKTDIAIFEPLIPGHQFMFFFIVPILLVIFAFIAAIAVILSIPHLINRIDIKKLKPEKIIKDFMNEFAMYYYMIAALFASSSIATMLYLKTPYMLIDEKKSTEYVNLLMSTLTTWSLIFFLILIIVIAYSFYLLLNEIREKSTSYLHEHDTFELNKITKQLNLNYMFSRYSIVLLSSFTPMFALGLGKMIF
ncbi:hypothetical protein SG34_025120 [Thalassomonas viridans]|uniref:Uncharacterized protein n=1 Tax=Thalassomonas viridans TaxID=137584 RepID=A0AAF0C8P0_9GAMM|nr:hypothetical protein [Thalassomonas viridans]WDE04576.1 hypothetical protein SG34_025120 [Thalassomonas viridans]